MMIKYFSEFLGTFFFVFVILNAAKFQKWPALTPILIVTGLLAAITISASVSGGHLNPAVSTAFSLTGDLPVTELAPYIGAQILGAVTAKYLFDYYSLYVATHS
jgi:aquaporin Z